MLGHKLVDAGHALRLVLHEHLLQPRLQYPPVPVSLPDLHTLQGTSNALLVARCIQPQSFQRRRQYRGFQLFGGHRGRGTDGSTIRSTLSVLFALCWRTGRILHHVLERTWTRVDFYLKSGTRGSQRSSLASSNILKILYLVQNFYTLLFCLILKSKTLASSDLKASQASKFWQKIEKSNDLEL